MNQEKVGKFIKEIRTKNNLTQKQFADILGVTFQAVSKWENGKNIPDISIMQDISKKFNIDINDLLEGETKQNTKDKKIYLYLIAALTILIIVVIFIIASTNNHDFEFKQISTTCDNFNITGSMAYNKDKTSLYISSVEFCGSDDNIIYESIGCTLYEEHNSDEKKISSCNTSKNITLEEYLKNVKISVDDYEISCKNMLESELYLEINGTLEDNKDIVYKIPITLLENSCSY